MHVDAETHTNVHAKVDHPHDAIQAKDEGASSSKERTAAAEADRARDGRRLDARVQCEAEAT